MIDTADIVHEAGCDHDHYPHDECNPAPPAVTTNPESGTLCPFDLEAWRHHSPEQRAVCAGIPSICVHCEQVPNENNCDGRYCPVTWGSDHACEY